MLVFTKGLPNSSIDILQKAMHTVYGDCIEFEELTSATVRSRVRLSANSVEVVLVVLDSSSYSECRGIENGLFKSDKYYTYTSDKDLVEFLNNKYSLSLEIEEEELIVEDIPSSDKEFYLSKIKFKDEIISNLENRIQDLMKIYSEETTLKDKDLSEKLKNANENNISLNNKILDLESTISSRNTKIAELENDLNVLKSSSLEFEKREKSISEKLTKTTSDLNDLRLKYSTLQSENDKKVKDYSDLLTRYKDLENNLKELSVCKSKIVDLNKVVNTLNASISEKDTLIVRQSKELESLRGIKDNTEEYTKIIDSLKNDLSLLDKDITDYKKIIFDKDNSISDMSMKISELDKEVKELTLKNNELKEKSTFDDNTIIKLNEDNLVLQGKLSLCDSSNTDYAILDEYRALKDKYASLSSNVLTRIGDNTSQRGSLNVKLVNVPEKFDNIRFIFSGTTESRKGTYKALYDKFANDKSETRYLLVDLVSETSVDYVFKSNVSNGIEWFRLGGSLQKYLSKSKLPNVNILSLGLSYVNDSYFLMIDWEKRLKELNMCGYKVILYCGDLSNLVGRVLYESFIDLGESIIYTSGSAVGSRNLITNIKGLRNSKNSKIAYFDFNPTVKKYYDIVSKTNNCVIISEKRS